MRGGRGHCDGGRVQVNYRAISAAFNFTHKSEKKKKKNSVCVPALYRTVYVSVCTYMGGVTFTRLAMGSTRAGPGKHTVKKK